MILKLDNMKINLVFVETILIFGLVSGEGLQRLILKSITLDLKPNPYSKFVDIKISGKHNDTATLIMPITEAIPCDVVSTNYIVYNGQEIPPIKSELSGLFDDKLFMPDVLEAGRPKDEFPRACPVPANDKYAVEKYKFSVEKLPPGLPDGTIDCKIYISRTSDDSDYMFYLHAEALLQTDLPEMSSFMG